MLSVYVRARPDTLFTWLSNSKMETIEPFADSFMLPTDPSVTLKDGIDLSKLVEGEGVSFEIDSSQPPPTETDWTEQAYTNEELFEHLKGECVLLGDDEDEEELSPFERMAKGMTDVSGDGCVLKKVLRNGIGSVVPEEAVVRVHYNGYLEYSDEPYDSSRLRNRQQQFRLGQGAVIPGWDVGISTMRKTELARFLVKPEYAFGKMGCPPRIPPDATIMYEVELMSFVDYKAAQAYDSLEREEKDKMSVAELVEVTNSLREAGNDLYLQDKFAPAASKYSKGVNILEPLRLKDEEDEKLWKDALLKLLLNLAQCCLKQGKAKPAIRHCRRVLELDRKNTKATFRLGQAYMHLGEFSKSRDELLKAARLAPGNKEIREKMVELEKKMKQFEALEKAMCSRMMQTSLKPAGTDSSSPYGEKTRKQFHEKLTTFLESSREELMLPADLGKEELMCVEQLCGELGLVVHKGDKWSQFAMRVTKPTTDTNDNNN